MRKVQTAGDGSSIAAVNRVATMGRWVQVGIGGSLRGDNDKEGGIVK